MSIFCLLRLTVRHVSSVFFFPDDDEFTVIPINVDKIGNQGEGYFVTKFWGETCNNYIYDGYEISKMVDIRDVKKGYHSLSFMGTKPGTQFLVTQPIFPATFVDPLDKVAYEDRETNKKIHQGHSSNRIAFGKLSMNEKRETFILDFEGRQEEEGEEGRQEEEGEEREKEVSAGFPKSKGEENEGRCCCPDKLVDEAPS